MLVVGGYNHRKPESPSSDLATRTCLKARGQGVWKVRERPSGHPIPLNRSHGPWAAARRERRRPGGGSEWPALPGRNSRLCVIQSVLTNTASAHQNQAGAPSPSGGPAARAGSNGTRARSTTATSRPNVASAACSAAPAGWLSSIEASHSRRCAHLAACLRSSGCSSSLHASAVPAVGLVEEGAGGRY